MHITTSVILFYVIEFFIVVHFSRNFGNICTNMKSAKFAQLKHELSRKSILQLPGVHDRFRKTD